MDFAALFPDAIMMQTLGDDVIYIPKGGSSTAIKAMVNYGTQQTFATDAYVPEKQMTVDVLKSDAPNCGKGGKFVHNGKTLTVDSLLSDDGVYATWVVR